MDAKDILLDGFGRIPDEVHGAVHGLTAEQLRWAPAKGANTVGWLVWHLSRVQDDHVADAAGLEQVWTSGSWHERLGLPFEAAETGYGHSAEQVAQVRGVDADQLLGYLDAVHQQTLAYVEGLSPEDLDRVVDRHWDPPVTLGVRLVSVVNDDTQHLGQAAYARGLMG